MEKLVSIIMPCFNGEKFLDVSIQSVLNQTYKNFELLIVNDGSTDESWETIMKYSKMDNRVIAFEHTNSGVAYTRNVGLANAKGDYIAFLDADDCWLEENLAKKISFLNNRRDISWVYSDMYLADEHLEITNVLECSNVLDTKNALLRRSGEIIHAPSGLVFRSECFSLTGFKFDKSATPSEDWDLCINMASKGFVADRIAEPTWVYRVLPGSLSRNMKNLEKGNIYVMKKAAENKLFDGFWLKQYCLANTFLILAGSWWVHGGSKLRAIYFLSRAFFNYPFIVGHLINKFTFFNIYQASSKPISNGTFNKAVKNASTYSVNGIKVLILLFHRVSPESDPLWNPVHPKAFERIIRYLKDNYEIIDLTDLVLNKNRYHSNKKYCAIGFDDGYKDFLDYAIPVLTKYDVPSSMYVVTDCVNNNLPPWTYVLNHLFLYTNQSSLNLSKYQLNGELMNTSWKSKEERLDFARNLNVFLKGVDNNLRKEIYRTICEQISDVSSPTGMMMNWEQIRSLAKFKCRVGSHTVSHPVLTSKLTENELYRELKESFDILVQQLNESNLTISYPFGAYNDDVVRIAKKVGYTLGVSVNPELYNVQQNDPYTIPRLELYNESFIKTFLRIKLLLPKIKKLFYLAES